MASIIVTIIIIFIGVLACGDVLNHRDPDNIITKEDEDFVLTVMFLEDMGKEIMKNEK